ncbi:hypothetical protein JW865_01035 [Candidatus Bathyarchaeota archaeon]|nr:hypothetical protein [Candidatus Bathyarchaeota archaeon]
MKFNSIEISRKFIKMPNEGGILSDHVINKLYSAIIILDLLDKLTNPLYVIYFVMKREDEVRENY